VGSEESQRGTRNGLSSRVRGGLGQGGVRSRQSHRSRFGASSRSAPVRQCVLSSAGCVKQGAVLGPWRAAKYAGRKVIMQIVWR
jgi:hypothetical protein